MKGLDQSVGVSLMMVVVEMHHVYGSCLMVPTTDIDGKSVEETSIDLTRRVFAQLCLNR
jgi:hypothetical protein